MEKKKVEAFCAQFNYQANYSGKDKQFYIKPLRLYGWQDRSLISRTIMSNKLILAGCTNFHMQG